MNIVTLDQIIKKDVTDRVSKGFSITSDTVTSIEKLASDNKANLNHIIESAVSLLERVQNGELIIVVNGTQE